MTIADWGMRSAECQFGVRTATVGFDAGSAIPHSAFRTPNSRASLARFGKEHLEGRPSLPRRVHPHHAPHVVHRTRDDGEAESRSPARLFGGVERFEDLLAVVGWNARSGIRHVQERPRLTRPEVGPRGAPLGAAREG